MSVLNAPNELTTIGLMDDDDAVRLGHGEIRKVIGSGTLMSLSVRVLHVLFTSRNGIPRLMQYC